ncbi:solute carrier family 22 member 7 [Dermacentor silvarum]|uniref:solute carrier family 22 member 7 n=1 Tax=Dermacentor silvarum TaxID=543639 RepID=UPI00189AC9A1|nr:solute carrier family 22 member 7 [Dermacentor silvarum]
MAKPPAALPGSVSRSTKMSKTAAKSDVPKSSEPESVGRSQWPGSAGSVITSSRLTATRLADDTGNPTPSETPVESKSAFGHGRFQKTMLLCAQLATMLAYSYSFALFIDFEPVEYWCSPPEHFANVSEEQWKNASIPRDTKGGFKQCQRYDPLVAPVSQLATTPFHSGNHVGDHLEASAQPPVAADRTNASEVPCESFVYALGTPGRNAVARWDMVCNKSWYKTLVKAAYTGASVLAIPCVGIASDIFGRRLVLLTTLAVVIGSGVATCLASSLVAYGILRCISSAACSAIEVTSFILLFESTQPGPRGPYCALAICWPTLLAPIYVAGLAILSKGWVIFNLLILLPSAFLLVTACLVEESPHWLLVSLRFEDAERVALYAARFNDEDTDRVRMRIDTIRHAAMLKRPPGRAASFLEATKRSLAATFMFGGLARRSFVLSVAWFTLYLVNYGGVATDDKSVSHHYELAKWLVVAGNAPAMAVAYFLVKFYDRLATTVMVMSTVSIALAVQSALVAFDLSLPLAVLIMWMKLLLNITYVVLCVHTVEMFPTEVRSVGFSGAYMWGRLGATSASALKEIEDQLIGSFKALPLALSALALAVASLFLVTLGDETPPEASMMTMMWQDDSQKEPKR